jgi:anaerobic magnesium-protoporphyrin IX monomethyl ester cyclase
MKGVILFNPRAMNTKPRIPNSVLTIASSIDGQREWEIVDGNRELDPWPRIEALLRTGRFGYFGCSSMPGPQLSQAIPFSKRIRAEFPEVKIVWGGYFAANQYKVVLAAPFVDVVISGPGDRAFPALLNAWEQGGDLATIGNLIYVDPLTGEIVKTYKDPLPDLSAAPPLPYERLDRTYPMVGYLPNTWLGRRTIGYHASFGCPFTCSFCAVVPIYEAKWKGASAQRIFDDVMMIREKWGGDAVEFHDNNFFTHRKRTVEFAQLMMGKGMTWWGEGRIDTLDKYSDEDLRLMRASGCRIIFFGAETGDDAVLAQMDKGGTQTGAQIKSFAKRMHDVDIIPEYSFVLGTPAPTEAEVMRRIDNDIAFIREVKAINPDTEIIIYVYSPVPTEGSEMYEQVKASGFTFPTKLEDWLDAKWEKFDLRKNPLTPWLKPEMVDKIRNFETVLNGYYPTRSDVKITNLQRKVIRAISTPRYKLGFYHFPYELKAVQKFWMRYRQPEIEGA